MTTFQKVLWAAIVAASLIALWAMGPEVQPETAEKYAAGFRARQIRLHHQTQADEAIRRGVNSLP